MSQNFLLKSKRREGAGVGGIYWDKERSLDYVTVTLLFSYTAAVLQSVNIPLTEGKTISIGSSLIVNCHFVNGSTGDMEEMIHLIEENWQRVVMYFLLRLVMAPCIETLLLIDRVLFLIGRGSQ